MPVTFSVASHPLAPVQAHGAPPLALSTLPDIESAMAGGILKSAGPRRNYGEPPVPTPKIVASTLRDQLASESNAQHTPNDNIPAPKIAPYTNGFFEAIISAYSQHHHLTISPDDVWIAILTQFSLYVNANAEELRAHFVSHQGQENIHVEGWPIGGPEAMQAFTEAMAAGIHRKVSDPDLADWILPNFTTTTPNHTIVCTVLMMATLKAYFTYSGGVCCGIPLITLEGEKADWESILARLDKLPSFGPEPTQWADLLRPILRRFVAAFDADAGVDLDFWSAICDQRHGSGFFSLSGWITAFCVWDEDGKWRGGNPNSLPSKSRSPPFARRPIECLVLDNVAYPTMHMSELPNGFAQADLLLLDDGVEIQTTLVAGHLGCEVNNDKIRPYPCWFLAKKS